MPGPFHHVHSAQTMQGVHDLAWPSMLDARYQRKSSTKNYIVHCTMQPLAINKINDDNDDDAAAAENDDDNNNNNFIG